MRLERDSIPLDKEFPFQISEVELNPSNSHPGTWHWHSYFEITWVLEGKGNYFVNGQEYTMEENDIIIFNNVEPHGWKLLGGRMKLLVMIFSPEFVVPLTRNICGPLLSVELILRTEWVMKRL